MKKWWLIIFAFILVGASAIGSEIDGDGDGLTNAEEESLGSDPSDPHDPIWVDDDGPGDGFPMNPVVSDPLEDGSLAHPFDSIQEAVNVATNGMTVLVKSGFYIGEGNYDINPQGRAIRIRSWDNDPEKTMINGLGSGSVFSLSSGETTNTVIQGFGITTTLSNCSDGDCGEQADVIMLDGASARIENCVIFNCDQSGIYCKGNSRPVVVDCTISNTLNGIWCIENSAPLIDNCKITSIGLTSCGDVGIGIYVDGSSNLLVRSSQVSDCNGRGLVLKDLTDAVLLQLTVQSCAGGITLDNSSPRIDRCVVQDNDAPNYFSLYGSSFASPVLLPLDNGDAIDVVDEDENGGGILLLRGSSPLIVNSLIARNRTWADDPDYAELEPVPMYGLGGGLYVGNGCSPTGVNCTVVDNHANTRGGGASSSGLPFFLNMIFWGNTSLNSSVSGHERFTSTDSIYHNLYCSAGDIDVRYSIIEYGYLNAFISSTNNPQFVGGSDYHLLSMSSPAVDSGMYYEGVTNDLDGNLRSIAPLSLVDAGCYEYIFLMTDSDGDGVSDGDEIIAGTNPTDGNDYFSLEVPRGLSGSLPPICWQSVTGRLYAVETSTNLMIGPWTPVAPGWTNNGTGDEMIYTNGYPHGSRYFRVKVWIP